MDMAVEPGVPYYMSFYDLNPSNQSQCIFIAKTTQRRCSWDCLIADNERAIELYGQIIRASSDIASLDLLKEYILCNCCRKGRAQHRDRIQYIDHLEPLAERWQQEILEHAGEASLLTALEAEEEKNVVMDGASTLAFSTASDVTQLDMQSLSSFTALSDGETLYPNGSTMSRTVATQSTARYASSNGKEPTSEPLTQQHYDLRPRDGNAMKNLAIRTLPRPRKPLPEFVPHINEPHLLENSVAYNLLNRLVDEEYDFRDGSLYIFDRSSSPGHVKIGWTSRTVQDRLDEWSKCGYTPNLLFSVQEVPNAHRAETLTHHELVMEWRREGICKAAHCRKSHEEWFEISHKSAEKVVSEWAEFMKRARPYDFTGKLKSEWKKTVQDMVDSGEAVTARKLLDRYNASVAHLTGRLDAIAINDGLGLPKAPLKVEDTIETTLVEKMSALGVEQRTNHQEELSLTNTVPEKDSRLAVSLPKTKEVKCEPQIIAKSLPKTEFTFAIHSPVTAEAVPKHEPSTRVGWLSQARLQPELVPKGRTVSKTARLPSSGFTFAFQSPVKAGSTETERSLQPGWLFGADTQPNSLAMKDAAEKEPSSEHIQWRPASIEAELQPEEIPLPLSPLHEPALFQLASDLETRQYQKTTSEPRAEPGSKESDDATASVDADDDTLLENEAEAETSAWDADETLVENAIQVSLQTVALKSAAGTYNNTPKATPAAALKLLDGQTGLESDAAVTVEARSKPESS
ncbi:T5orf172 domain-containing protein [Leptodontidium sp. 2 PMI_412]|nr:T5orf172 domain-containing protein [Leptodontidium sp. 2 PMI_412]